MYGSRLSSESNKRQSLSGSSIENSWKFNFFLKVPQPGHLRHFAGRIGGYNGGDLECICSAVQDQLRNVQQIHLSGICCNLGRWICCFLGDPYNGGDYSAVRDQLRNVQRLEATESAFAAILADGSVAWGEHNYGGYFNCSQVQDHLQYL